LEEHFPTVSPAERAEMNRVFTALLWGVQEGLVQNPQIPRIHLSIDRTAGLNALAQMELRGDKEKQTIQLAILKLNPDFIPIIRNDFDSGLIQQRTGRPGIPFANHYEIAAILGAHEVKHADPAQLSHSYFDYLKVTKPLANDLGMDPPLVHNSQPRERDSIFAEAKIATMIHSRYAVPYSDLLQTLKQIWQIVGPILMKES
jgi:hypothetical protein